MPSQIKYVEMLLQPPEGQRRHKKDEDFSKTNRDRLEKFREERVYFRRKYRYVIRMVYRRQPKCDPNDGKMSF